MPPYTVQHITTNSRTMQWVRCPICKHKIYIPGLDPVKYPILIRDCVFCQRYRVIAKWVDNIPESEAK